MNVIELKVEESHYFLSEVGIWADGWETATTYFSGACNECWNPLSSRVCVFFIKCVYRFITSYFCDCRAKVFPDFYSV